MCGRFTLTADENTVLDRFNATKANDFEYVRRYNIAPSQTVLAIVNDGL
ncbi:hypothetical protein GCM10010965_27030 [Caldalkalibacillus thermarum]|nr:hypothetical protein GCM10010965_27030 [Caldalkalibacillus thermarum]